MDQTSPHNGYHHIFMNKIGIWVHVKNYKHHIILIHASPFSISTSRIMVPVVMVVMGTMCPIWKPPPPPPSKGEKAMLIFVFVWRTQTNEAER